MFLESFSKVFFTYRLLSGCRGVSRLRTVRGTILRGLSILVTWSRHISFARDSKCDGGRGSDVFVFTPY